MLWLYTLVLTLIFRTATAASCCPDENILVFREKRCSGHEEEFSFFKYSLNCSEEHIEILDPSKFTVRPEDDSLLVGEYTIPTGKYCITSVLDENDTMPTDVKKAIVCVSEEFTNSEFSMEFIVYTVCVILSAVLLLLTLLVYLLVPQLRDLQGKCLICTVFCLCMLYTMIAFLALHGVDSVFISSYCAYVALFTYFWMIASFFWLNAVSFNIWRSAVFYRFPMADRHLMLIYFAYGWGVPLVLLTAATVTHHLPTEEQDFASSCWIDGPTNLIFYVSLPVVLLIFLNTLFFLWTCCRLWSRSGQGQPAHKIRSLRYKCVLYLKLFIIMGITWVIRILGTLLPNTTAPRMAINMAVYLQGLFIFLILVLFRKRALKGLGRTFPCKCFLQDWTAGEDHEESEEILPEEVELSQTTT